MSAPNPLAAIEGLADRFERRIGYVRSLGPGKSRTDAMHRREANTWDVATEELRTALTEARQAVDALVAERDAARSDALRWEANAHRGVERMVSAEHIAAQVLAERDAAREALAQAPRIEITQKLGKPTTCVVTICGTAVFTGADFSSLAQPATDDGAGQ